MAACAYLVLVYGLRFDLHDKGGDGALGFMSDWVSGQPYHLAVHLVVRCTAPRLCAARASVLAALLQTPASRWLFANLVSFLQSGLLLQPLKITFMGLFFFVGMRGFRS